MPRARTIWYECSFWWSSLWSHVRSYPRDSMQHTHLKDCVIAVLGQQRLLIIAALTEAKARRHFGEVDGVKVGELLSRHNGMTPRQLPNACPRS